MPPLPAACAALLVLLASLSAAAASPAVPLEVYGRLPALEEVCLSPDGTRIAFVRAIGDERAIAVRSLADRKLLGVVSVKDPGKVRTLEWIDDNRLMILESSTEEIDYRGSKVELYRLGVYDVATSRLIPIRSYNGGRVAVRRLNGHLVVFFPTASASHLTTHRYLEGDDLDGITENVTLDRDGDSWDWLIDAQGKLVAEQRYSQEKQRWTFWIRSDGNWKQVAEGGASLGSDIPRMLGFGPAADTLLMDMRKHGEAGWKPLSLQDGSLGPSIAEGKPLGDPIEDRRTNRLIGGSYRGDTRRFVFFEPAMQAHWDAIVQAFGDDHVRFESASSDFRKILVLVDGPKYGYQYQLVDLDTHKSDWVGDVYDGITEAMQVRRIDYPAADNLSIPAYLTLPRGRTAKSLPLIVLVHGGPVSRDDAHFDWWSQALAEQGYAVLQPNFRGSSVNMEAGFGEFGRKMQTDLSDGVRHLVGKGIADPARVCIIGGSYGGYAALAGVTLDPGAYRCAVSVAGLSDLKRLLRQAGGWRSDESTVGQRFWDRFMGVTDPNDPVVARISPIKHVEAVNVPVLLIHGKDDTVVPYDQSYDMYDALRHAGKTVELVQLKREDHWLSRGETRLQMLQATVAFLRKYNPPD